MALKYNLKKIEKKVELIYNFDQHEGDIYFVLAGCYIGNDLIGKRRLVITDDVIDRCNDRFKVKLTKIVFDPLIIWNRYGQVIKDTGGA